MTTALSADAVRIIGRLQEIHASMNAAGLGSPALDAFINLLGEMTAAAPDPVSHFHEIVELMTQAHGETAESA